MRKIIVSLILCLLPMLAAAQSNLEDSLFNIGKELYNKGKFAEAIPYFLSVDSILSTDNSRQTQLVMASWLAPCYEKTSDNTNAYSQYYRALQYYKLRKDTISIASVLTSMGECKENEWNFAEAVELLKQSIPFWKSAGEDTVALYMKSKLIKDYYQHATYRSKDSGEKESYLKEALAIGKENWDIALRTSYEYEHCLHVLAMIYMQSGRKAEALSLFYDEKKLRETVGDIEDNDYLQALYYVAKDVESKGDKSTADSYYQKIRDIFIDGQNMAKVVSKVYLDVLPKLTAEDLKYVDPWWTMEQEDSLIAVLGSQVTDKDRRQVDSLSHTHDAEDELYNRVYIWIDNIILDDNSSFDDIVKTTGYIKYTMEPDNSFKDIIYEKGLQLSLKARELYLKAGKTGTHDYLINESNIAWLSQRTGQDKKLTQQRYDEAITEYEKSKYKDTPEFLKLLSNEAGFNKPFLTIIFNNPPPLQNENERWTHISRYKRLAKRVYRKNKDEYFKAIIDACFTAHDINNSLVRDTLRMWLSEAEKIADSGIKADNKSQRHRLWEDLLTLYDYQQDLSLDFDQEEHYAIKKMETATKGVGSTKDFNIETTARDLANKYMSIEKYDKAYKMLMYLKNYNDTNYTHSPFVQNKKDRRTSDNLLYLTQSLQSYYMDLGNYKKAEEINDMEHSMIEALRKKGDNSLGQQQLNNNLSLLSIYTNSCKTKDDWRHCLKLCDNLSKWSSQHLMKQFGTDNDWRSLNYVVPVLFKKRYVLMQLDDYDGAIRCIGTLDSIMNLYPSMFPKQERLRQQFNLYNCYRLKGDTLRSNALLDDISRKAGQIENIDWQLSTNILFANASRSIEEVFNGRPVSDDDIKTINLISDRLTSIVKYNFQFMTYTERTNFWNGWSAWFQTFIPNMAFADRDGRLLPLAYNSALLGKNILLNSEMEIADIVAKSGDTSLQYAYKKLLDDKAALSQAIQGKSKNADELGDKVDNEERELIKRSVALDDYTKRLTMDWTAVRDNLKGGEAAVEFMSCKGKDNTEAYLALIVTHSCKAPKIVRLNLQDLLNELSSNELYTTDTLYAVLWVPVIDAIGDKKLTTIYFSPVSHLHSTAIEYAPMPDGKPINSKYNIFRLSSTREVALMERAKDKKPRSLSVLYGGLDYGASPSAIATENKRQGYREMPGYAFTANDSTLRAGVSFW